MRLAFLGKPGFYEQLDAAARHPNSETGNQPFSAKVP